MSLDEWKDLGARAIRPEAPAGAPSRDEPEFEALQREIRKLELPDGQQPEWSSVLQNAAVLLGRKSKDLLVGAYLGLALLHREGYAGLAVGLTVLADMVEAYWESLFPELSRLRGRVAAFDWLAERAGKAISTRPSEFGSAEALDECRGRLAELMNRLEIRVPGGWEGMHQLRRALDEAESSLKSSTPPPTATKAPTATAAAAAPATIATADDATRALQEFRDLGRRIGEFLRASEPGNPLGYRLPRMVSWVPLRELPPNADGKTQIPGPQPADFAAKVAEMLDRGQWAGALEQAESRFGTAILWLDLHRFTATALEGMGHAEAAQGLVEEVGALLRRLPGLDGLRFANDQPLADEATRAWIQARLRPAADAGEAGGAASSPAASSPQSAGETVDIEELPKVRSQAQSLARQKRLDEGLALLDSRAARAQTLRGRVRWKLEAARLSMQAGRHETAFAQLQALDETMRSSQAEDWAPDLSAEVIKNLFLAHRDAVSSVHPRPIEEVERSRELRRRLSRLDIAAALSLEDKR